MTLTLRPLAAFPELRWAPPEAANEGLKTDDGRGQKGGLMERVRNMVQTPKHITAATEPPVSDQSTVPHNIDEMLREKAETFRQGGDYLSAALYFALAGDTVNAAWCYAENARTMRRTVKF